MKNISSVIIFATMPFTPHTLTNRLSNSVFPASINAASAKYSTADFKRLFSLLKTSFLFIEKFTMELATRADTFDTSRFPVVKSVIDEKSDK